MGENGNSILVIMCSVILFFIIILIISKFKRWYNQKRDSRVDYLSYNSKSKEYDTTLDSYVYEESEETNNEEDDDEYYEEETDEYEIPMSMFQRLENLKSEDYLVYRNKSNNTIWLLDINGCSEFFQKLDINGKVDVYSDKYEKFTGEELFVVLDEGCTDLLDFIACKIDGTVIMYNNETDKNIYPLNPDGTVMFYPEYEKL